MKSGSEPTRSFLVCGDDELRTNLDTVRNYVGSTFQKPTALQLKTLSNFCDPPARAEGHEKTKRNTFGAELAGRLRQE
jgi:hypothetical protein